MQDETRAPLPPPELASRLRSSIGRRCGDPDGWTVELVSENGPPGRKRRLLRARHPASGRSLAIKENSAPAHSRRQYRALRRLRRATRDSVAPHYLSEDGRFFVMEWVEAPLLQERLAGPERPTDLARAGAWLARLQSATGRSPLLTRKPYTLRVPDDGARGAVHDRLRARMRLVSQRRGPIAMLHGDFHPGNVFAEDDRLLVFDAKLDRDGAAFIDLANFLLSVAHLRALAAEAGQPWRGDEEEDRRRFFEGFGAIGESDLALYDLIEDLTIFRRWLRHRDEGDSWFEEQMGTQGLFEPEGAGWRPGRMIAAAGGEAYWTNEPAPPPRPGLVRRAAIRLGLSLPRT